MNKVMVTGGAGFVGSHVLVQLLDAGLDVIALDNLCNSSADTFGAIEKICGKQVPFVKLDIRDALGLAQVFAEHKVDAIIHCAGLKAVGESVSDPIDYYDNNVNGSLVLLRAARNAKVPRMVFSSSATVYGVPKETPLSEDHSLAPINPYGYSKMVIERLFADEQQAAQLKGEDFSTVNLRYFNPVGAHASGLIGENPNGKPNNIMPLILQTASGQRDHIEIYGKDYDTKDGTGVRDYVHVLDLSDGHLRALKFLEGLPRAGAGTYNFNLGTGRGTSVLELIKTFEKVSKKRIPYKISPRREGDVATSFANPALAKQQLGWSAHKNISQMCEDSWRFQLGKAL